MSLHVIFRKSMTTPLVVFVLLSAAFAPIASAQLLDMLDADCEPAWVPTFGAEGVDRPVTSSAVFDDGTGPALYVSGEFIVAGGAPANHIAKWDGSSWSPVDTGMGFGYAAELIVFDDGSGPALFVGGQFQTIGGVPANSIAKWNGQSWAPLGSGINGSVGTMTIFDDGTGPALYVGGFFSAAGGVAANKIAKWNGQSWSPLKKEIMLAIGQRVSVLAVFDDGSGPALFVGATSPPPPLITEASVPLSFIFKWDGQSWSPLGSGVTGAIDSHGNDNAFVATLTVFDDGSGPALYVGGFFSSAGSITASSIAKWNGQKWSPLGKGVRGVGFQSVNALIVFDDGTGAALYVGGNFTTAGSIPANFIAKWDGQSWSTLGSGVNLSVSSLTDFDDGSGPALYVGGFFSIAGSIQARHLAKWDGQSWSPLSNGLPNSTNSLAVFDDGLGSALFAGGNFTYSPAGDAFLAKWKGCAVTNPADLDGDGVVNGADLAVLLTNWGPCQNSDVACRADLNADGVVDSSDLAFLLANWG